MPSNIKETYHQKWHFYYFLLKLFGVFKVNVVYLTRDEYTRQPHGNEVSNWRVCSQLVKRIKQPLQSNDSHTIFPLSSDSPSNWNFFPYTFDTFRYKSNQLANRTTPRSFSHAREDCGAVGAECSPGPTSRMSSKGKKKGFGARRRRRNRKTHVSKRERKRRVRERGIASGCTESRRGKGPEGDSTGPLKTKGNGRGKLRIQTVRSFVFSCLFLCFTGRRYCFSDERQKSQRGGLRREGVEGQAFAFVRATRSFVVPSAFSPCPRILPPLADLCRCFSFAASFFSSPSLLFLSFLLSLHLFVHASVQLTATRSRSAVRGPREVGAGCRSLLFAAIAIASR